MRRYVITFFTALLISLSLSPVALNGSAAALDPFLDACKSNEAKVSTVCKTTGEDPISGKNGILYKVARILGLIAAIGAVIVMIIGGFMYVLANGDTNQASNGRKAIIGAAVGILVIGLSQAFIALVINLVN